MSTDVLLKLAYVVIYLGCLVGQHYGLLPTGCEIIAVGIFAGEGIATAVANKKAGIPAPATTPSPPAPLSIPDQQG